MKLLPKQIRKETFIYSIDLPSSEFKKQLEELFKKRMLDLLSINLTGEFKSDNEFSVTKKFSSSFTKGGGQSFTTLKGKIEDQNQRTQLTLTIKPNPTVYVFAIAFPLAGYALGIQSIINWEINGTNLIVILFFGIICPIGACLFGQIAKDELRNKFVKYFGLKMQGNKAAYNSGLVQ